MKNEGDKLTTKGRQSSRVRVPKKLYPIEDYVNYNRFSQCSKVYVSNLINEKIPRTNEEALTDNRWKSAINEEINALENNQTWEIIDKQQNKKSVGCRWLFTIKYKPNGDIERFKARLVAKGYTQVYGIDFLEKFSLVAKMSTVRILI